MRPRVAVRGGSATATMTPTRTLDSRRRSRARRPRRRPGQRDGLQPTCVRAINSRLRMFTGQTSPMTGTPRGDADSDAVVARGLEHQRVSPRAVAQGEGKVRSEQRRDDHGTDDDGHVSSISPMAATIVGSTRVSEVRVESGTLLDLLVHRLRIAVAVSSRERSFPASRQRGRHPETMMRASASLPKPFAARRAPSAPLVGDEDAHDLAPVLALVAEPEIRGIARPAMPWTVSIWPASTFLLRHPACRMYPWPSHAAATGQITTGAMSPSPETRRSRRYR